MKGRDGEKEEAGRRGKAELIRFTVSLFWEQRVIPADGSVKQKGANGKQRHRGLVWIHMIVMFSKEPAANLAVY